jgi:hypothetical protein
MEQLGQWPSNLFAPPLPTALKFSGVEPSDHRIED